MFKVNPQTDLALAIDIMPVFQEGGKLAVAGGKAVVAPAVRIMQKFPKKNREATQDKHKPGSLSIHSSYIDVPANTLITTKLVRERMARGDGFIASHALFTLRDVFANLIANNDAYMAWVEHGFPDDPETEVCPEIVAVGLNHIEVKAFDNPTTDSNSVFKNALGETTGYGERLKERGIKRIVMFGLATDYCVGLSALDACVMGFEVYVVQDAVAAVGYPEGHKESMQAQMEEAGVRFIREADIVA